MSDPFTLQAHITDACDLQCRHCYRDQRRRELPLPAWRAILDDFTAFCRSRRIAGRVTFSGGEPLARYADLLELTRHAAQSHHQVHILTNGILLTPPRAAELKAAGCLRIQVSIDGDPAGHETLRGPGTYAAAVRGLEHAAAAGMATTISMTIGTWNTGCVDAVAQLAQRCGAKLFISRLVPCGSGAALAGQTLTPRAWLRIMRQCLRWGEKLPGGVALRDPMYARLQPRPRAGESCVSGCACGYSGLAVESDGVAYACRRLALCLGNLTQTSLEEIWRSDALERLRDRDALEGACRTCRARWQCGGCRAIAHAVTGNAAATDPQCPWANPKPLTRLVQAVAQFAY